MSTDWRLILELGLTAALAYFKSLGKPLEEITYEDLKNFRSFDQALAEAAAEAKTNGGN